MKKSFSERMRFKSTWQLHFMLIPAIIIVIIFSYIPMVGVVIAFQDFMPGKGFFGSPWVGFERFQYLFKLPDMYLVVRNTVIISILKIVTILTFSLIMALLINEVMSRWFKSVTQTVFLFPYFLSWVILGGIFVDVFSMESGLSKFIYGFFNIEPIFFLGEGGWFRAILIVTNIWKDMGYNMIIFLAALTNIDPTLYESAVIDGASRPRQTLHITIPSIVPMIALLACLAIGGILNAGFDQIFVMYNPLVYNSVDIIDTYVYRLGLVSAQYSLATAAGLFKSAVGFVLIILSYWLAGKYAGYRLF
ncbi:sugar ABC transporter permease [Spirochaetia bacterium]|nr:sugar ABC transporter permease [Spirochaetia bacterium]